MKKTINGKVYDTDKARILGRRTTGNGIDRKEETLYSTPRSSSFFLVGTGGINTKYKGKKRLFPVTEDHAKAWIIE